MQRKKQHRIVLKNIIKDERTTPDRAILAERLLKCLDAREPAMVRMYELLTLQHIGGAKLVELYLSQLEHLPTEPVKRLLRDDDNDGGHITTQNRLLRDRRSHPNRRLGLQLDTMNEDADTQQERQFYLTVIFGGMIDIRQHFKLTGTDDEPVVETHLSNPDKAVMEQVKKYMNALTGGTDVAS